MNECPANEQKKVYDSAEFNCPASKLTVVV